MRKLIGINNWKDELQRGFPPKTSFSSEDHDVNVLQLRSFIDTNFDSYSKHIKIDDSHVLLHKVKLLDPKKTVQLKQKIKDLNYTLSGTMCGKKFWKCTAFRIEKEKKFEAVIEINA